MASRLERLVGIEKVIRTGRYPGVYDLCDMFEIRPRTLFLDIKELRDNLGCQIKFDRARQGYYSITSDQKLPSFSLTEDEIFVLAIAAELFTQVSESSIATALQLAVEKIAQGCIPNYYEKTQLISSVIRAANPYNNMDFSLSKLSKLRSLCDACINMHLIIVGTNSTDDQLKETIEPHYLEHAISRWFLVGYSRSKQQIFHRALDSIADYELTETSFERRSDLLLP